MIAEFQPYVGPKPFEETDKDLFFGRDAEANDLFSLIVAHPAVLVYAQSGAGKTSLLNAKIVPALKSKGYEVLPLARVQGLQPKEEGSNIYVFNTVISWADGQKPEWSDLDGVSLADFLKQRPHVQKIRELPVAAAGNGSENQSLKASNMTEANNPDSEESAELWELPRVAVFDQFEELFTSYPNRWPEREEFFTQIRAALDCKLMTVN